MRRIAVINQKGGVGKTTTTANVAAALARAGHRVLVIDLDPQSHLSLHLGVDPAAGRPGTYELLTGSTSIAKCRVKVANNLWAVGSSIDLAAAEVELVSLVGREVILRDLLDQHVGLDMDPKTSKYDYVLIDCPPSLGVLTLNGLCAAQEVVIPLQPHYLALQGLSKLLETVLLVGKRIYAGLKVGGIVICMYEAGTKLAAEVVEDVRAFLESAKGAKLPWSSAQLYRSVIRRNIKLAEAPSYGQSIFDYAPDSNGAKDYEALAAEIDGRVERVVAPAVPEVVVPAAVDPHPGAGLPELPVTADVPVPVEGEAALAEPMHPDALAAEVAKLKRPAKCTRPGGVAKADVAGVLPAPAPGGSPP